MRYYIYSSTFMYKRAREVVEFYLVAYLSWFYGRCLATGQTSSLSKLMMQHEVAWLFQRQSRIARVQLGHTQDFQFAHCCKCQLVRGDVWYIYIAKASVRLQHMVSKIFNSVALDGKLKDRRIGGNIWIWTKLARTLYCKLENSNIWNVIHSCKEGIHDGVICYREGGAKLTVACREKSLFRVVMYFPTCCIKPSEKITLDSIWF